MLGLGPPGYVKMKMATGDENSFPAAHVLMSVLGPVTVINPSACCESRENQNDADTGPVSTVISGHRNRKTVNQAPSNLYCVLIHIPRL